MSSDLDPVERRVVEHLDGLGLPYELIRIDPALADTAQFCAHYGYPLDVSCNCIVVKTRTGPRRYAACVVPATMRLDANHAVRALLGARKVSFAGSDETAELTGMTPGGVTPLGLPPELPVFVERRVVELDEVILGGGSRRVKIKTVPAVFDRLERASWEPIAVPSG